MSKNEIAFIKHFPKRRRLVSDIGAESNNRYSMKGLIEVDITDAKSLVRNSRRSENKPLSFTAFLIHTIAQVIFENPEVNACLMKHNKIAYFNTVNILTMIEVKNTDGQSIPIGHLIKSVEKLSLFEVEKEICDFRNNYSSANETKKLDIITSLPYTIRKRIIRSLFRNPNFISSTMGTVVISAVGMFVPNHAAWAMSKGNHTISFWVGSTVKRIVKLDNQFVERTMACITIDIDHEIVDGAPAARFISRIIERIEKPILVNH